MERLLKVTKCLVLPLALVLAVVDIILPLSVEEQTRCVDDTNLTRNVGIPKWFVIHGALRAAVILYLVIMEALPSLTTAVKKTLYVVLGFFDVAWLLIGMVLFWRECIDTGSRPVNRLATITLICGVLFWIYEIYRFGLKRTTPEKHEPENTA
jgi:hypothetical protein